MPRPDPSEIRSPATRDRDFLGVFGVLEDARGLLVAGNRRHVNGRWRRTWDLPGGQVEAGETLPEALVREFREETGLRVAVGEFLFVQEGEKVVAGKRAYVWRSFFFRVRRAAGGRLCASGEVEAVRFLRPRQFRRAFTAPYHGGFLRWLAQGAAFLPDRWCET